MTATIEGPRHTAVIGLMGQKQSGKDTVADFLVSNHGFMKIAFADALKDSLIALDPYLFEPGERLSVIVKQIGWDSAKVKYQEVRRLLQRLGTDVGRDILGEDVWTRIMEQKLDHARANGADVVVTDVRFINEAQVILDHAGYLARIDRPGLPDDDDHRSEHEWRHIMPDFMIPNDGDLELLSQAVEILAGITHCACNDMEEE